MLFVWSISMLFLSGRHNFAPGEYIAVTNGGSVRAGLKAGPVLEKALDAVLPFGNEVRFGLINGTTIRLMLERSVWDIPGGPFLSIQGLRFWYDPARAQGSRVQTVEVRSRLR
jgi:2',3'-cyclic-nucleotide 2'-phosphodiesterase (5'-nucleotidase family)